jgi:hypothetical protein
MVARIAFRIVVALVLIAFTGSADELAAISEIRGSWKISHFFCSGCGARTFHEKGMTIQFADQRITDPTGDNCTANPDYRMLNEVSTKKILANEGKSWPTSFRRTLAALSTVRYGFVTCGGINYMQLIVATPKTAFYFFEGGIVFELEREPKSGSAGEK